MKKSDVGFKKPERKTMEKNRRIHMKWLCYKLSSLVPSLFFQPYKKLYTQGDLFNQSTAYIKQLRKRIEGLKQKRDGTLRLINDNISNNVVNNRPVAGNGGVSLPMVDVKEVGTCLQVLLITGLKRKFSFCDVVSIMEDGGAEVVNGGYTTVGDKVYYTLHAQARVSRVGVDATSICERLQELTIRSS